MLRRRQTRVKLANLGGKAYIQGDLAKGDLAVIGKAELEIKYCVT